MKTFNSFDALVASISTENAWHVGHVRDEDVKLLKQIMRDTVAVELETIDLSVLVSEALKRIKAQSPFDRAFAEPQLEAYVREEFHKLKERYKKEKQNAKDRLNLETASEITWFDD